MSDIRTDVALNAARTRRGDVQLRRPAVALRWDQWDGQLLNGRGNLDWHCHEGVSASGLFERIRNALWAIMQLHLHQALAKG